jgi:hypothetical protein
MDTPTLLPCRIGLTTNRSPNPFSCCSSSAVHVAGEFYDRRHIHAGTGKQPFARHLVERQPARFGTAAGVDQATILENPLKLAILAELAVQGQKEHVDVPAVEDLHVVRPNIRRDYIEPGLLHRSSATQRPPPGSPAARPTAPQHRHFHLFVSVRPAARPRSARLPFRPSAFCSSILQVL